MKLQGFRMHSCAQEEREKLKAKHRAQVQRMKGEHWSFPSALCAQGRQGGRKVHYERMKDEDSGFWGAHMHSRGPRRM